MSLRRIGVCGIVVVLMVTFFGHLRPASASLSDPPRVSVGDGSVVEGQMTRRYIRFTVSLSWKSSNTVTVQYATANGLGPTGATAGPDYKAKAGTITFKPGQTGKYLAVLVWPDMVDEPEENFTFSLSNPQNAVAGRMVGTGTIHDDDPNVGPRVGVGDVAAVSTCAGNPIHASAVVTLSVAQSVPVDVQITTSPLTATGGVDYKNISKVVRFSASQNLKEARVVIPADMADAEGDEQLQVNISVVTGPVLVGRGTGTVTIMDCSPAP
jgi:hypothetical protein